MKLFRYKDKITEEENLSPERLVKFPLLERGGLHSPFSIPTPHCNQVATIGFFDGVHRGHRYLMEQVRMLAEKTGMESMAVTFDRHPRQVLDSDYRPRLLSTPGDKLRLLSETGVDNCAVLPFDSELASLPARDFMEKVLRDRLNVRKLVIGYDNRFGHNRAEGFDDYVRYGGELGIGVVRGKAFVHDGVRVSSSIIRSYIENGDMERANACLGYAYTVTGRVVGGFREGRKLGFPTANLDMEDPCRMVPANGVYAVTVRMPETGVTKRAMMNIGVRPTFEGRKVTLEVHILDFSGDIYGKEISVSFVSRIRDERKFGSVDELARQLREDERMVEGQFKKNV